MLLIMASAADMMVSIFLKSAFISALHSEEYAVAVPDGLLFMTDAIQTDRQHLFSMTTWVSQHQKGKTSLDFNKARHDGVAVASAGPYANQLHLAPDRQPR